MMSIEVSMSQRQVHIDDLKNTLKSNQKGVLLGGALDWTLVDIAKDEQEATKKAAFWEGVMGGAEHER